MNILTREDVRALINETANDDDLRARLKEFADMGKIDEEQKAFAQLVTELDAHLAKAAGRKPTTIDPKTDKYGSGTRARLEYKINGAYIRILGSTEYMSVTTLEIYSSLHTCANVYIRDLGPQKAVEVAVGITAAIAE